MSKFRKDSWERFLANLRSHEGGDAGAFEATRLSALEMLAYRPPERGIPDFSPGNLSLPARWLARHSPSDVVTATRGLLASNSLLACIAVREVVTLLGWHALPLMEDMRGKVIDYRCLIAAVEGALDTRERSPELESAADEILDRLAGNITPPYSPAIVRLVVMRGAGAMLPALSTWECGDSPHLACYASALIEGYHSAGDDGARAVWRRFDFGLPVTAISSMKWKPEWEPLRRLIEREGVPCVRLRSHPEADESTSKESFLLGLPAMASIDDWPAGTSGDKMIYFARLGRDFFALGGYPDFGAIDLWMDGHGAESLQNLEGYVGPFAKAMPARRPSEEGDEPLKRAYLSMEACLELPREDFEEELPEALRDEFDSFKSIAHGFEGNFMHQAFGRIGEDGANLLYVREDLFEGGLSQPVRFSMDPEALQAGDFREVRVSLDY